MKNLVIIFLLLSTSSVHSQGKKGFQVLVTGENDFFAVNNKDENYTGGLKIEVLTPGIRSKILPFYKFKSANSINVQRFAVGAVAYTPQDLASKAVVMGDRPYASLVFFSIGNTGFNTKKKKIIQSDLIVGNMGGKGPGSAQAYIHSHHWSGSVRDVPEGWPNQVGAGSTFIVNYNTRFQFLISPGKSVAKAFQWLQLNGVVKADIGNYMINLQAGPKLNFINYNSEILQEGNPDISVLLADSIITGNQKKKLRFNFFVEPHFRLAAYNATLEGNMFNDHSIYKIPHGDVKRILFELNAGFNVLFFDLLYLRYSFYGRSREFSGGKPFHTWGSVTVGFSPPKWNYK